MPHPFFKKQTEICTPEILITGSEKLGYIIFLAGCSRNHGYPTRGMRLSELRGVAPNHKHKSKLSGTLEMNRQNKRLLRHGSFRFQCGPRLCTPPRSTTGFQADRLTRLHALFAIDAGRYVARMTEDRSYPHFLHLAFLRFLVIPGSRSLKDVDLVSTHSREAIADDTNH